MKYSVGEFAGTLVGLLVGAVILGAMITVFGDITIGETVPFGDTISSLISMIPMLGAVGLLLMAIFYFISRK